MKITKETTIGDLLRHRSVWQVVELGEPVKVSAYTDVKTAEALMKQAGILHDWDYARDGHFSRWIIGETVKTMEDVEAFLAKLDKDNEEQTKPPFRWGCTKAKQIRSWLNKPFWTENMGRVMSAIAPARRVCCSCHETGSFARYDKKQ